MSILDIYLQRNGKKRYDVFKETGISQQTLASVNKKKVSSYSVKTIQAIAKTVQKSEGEVLNELLRLEKENATFEAYNYDDLLVAFDNKELYIFIRGEFKTEIETLAQSQLSETETLGIELGSDGTANILAEGFNQLAKLFSQKENEENEQDERKKIEKIESKMRMYKMKKNSKGELLLYLRQLDY
ncbi:hypothetical protein WQ54_28770 [Bacillus sp. SA1-12]|uniref:helix-turn-helix domain-containing protein n=1 Tax=Bacillus sp. SA1-12 TaxID=1455638 RepID=UPI000627242F|nr:helix-turn-helix domain-containing protein [Bacillus sp. SA1-12]KKI88917.1 hypothetical protein WQ54_28770 [Bacillus sp. SA1-12]